jgi:nitrite reductase (NADH) large subunit
MSEPLVVIGNGMAAARFADELSSRALGRYAVRGRRRGAAARL